MSFIVPRFVRVRRIPLPLAWGGNRALALHFRHHFAQGVTL